MEHNQMKLLLIFSHPYFVTVILETTATSKEMIHFSKYLSVLNTFPLQGLFQILNICYLLTVFIRNKQQSIASHGSDILALRQNFVVGPKKWIFVNRILC